MTGLSGKVRETNDSVSAAGLVNREISHQLHRGMPQSAVGELRSMDVGQEQENRSE